MPARYGPEIVGGAEIVLAEMARGLAARGWDAEILTTCALDHHTWENVLPPGATVEGGLPVRRFPTVKDSSGRWRGEVEHSLHLGGRPTLAEQQRWINDGMRSPELFHFLLDRASEYRALIFTPYPNWITFACSQVAPERSVLWTCLHDEPYAYLELFQPVLTGVAGLWFQSGPELDLARRIVDPLPPHALVGCGVSTPPLSAYSPDRFRKRYGIEGPFVLYAGRREGAKGWADLLDGFASAVTRHALPFSLVTMGAGAIGAPAPIANRVIDVGFLPDEDRDDAYAAAAAYIQPSRFEAFSRTIMEAWLAGTPVIANAGSEVVAWHCERSGAGLVYDTPAELGECLAFVAASPDGAAALAAPGRDYVLSQYQWPAVLDRIEACLDAWTPPEPGHRAP